MENRKPRLPLGTHLMWRKFEHKHLLCGVTESGSVSSRKQSLLHRLPQLLQVSEAKSRLREVSVCSCFYLADVFFCSSCFLTLLPSLPLLWIFSLLQYDSYNPFPFCGLSSAAAAANQSVSGRVACLRLRGCLVHHSGTLNAATASSLSLLASKETGEIAPRRPK